MIEDAIAKLTAAVEANTAAIREVLLAGGTDIPAPVAEEPKPAPAKKKAVVEVKTPEPVVETKEPVVTDEEPAAETPAEAKFTIVEAIEASKKFLAADRDTNKPKLEALRGKFGIATVKDLAPDQIDAYMAELAKL